MPEVVLPVTRNATTILDLSAGFPVVVGNFEIGQPVSWVALVVALVLAAGLFREARH